LMAFRRYEASGVNSLPTLFIDPEVKREQMRERHSLSPWNPRQHLILAGQNVPHHKPAKDCRFSESSTWGSELDSNCRDGHARQTRN